jgi:hypothetical protein
MSKQFTDEELKAARVQLRELEQEEHDRRHREIAERNQQILRDLDGKYRAEAGVDEEEWDRLQDIIWRYREELDRHGL